MFLPFSDSFQLNSQKMEVVFSSGFGGGFSSIGSSSTSGDGGLSLGNGSSRGCFKIVDVYLFLLTGLNCLIVSHVMNSFSSGSFGILFMGIVIQSVEFSLSCSSLEIVVSLCPLS